MDLFSSLFGWQQNQSRGCALQEPEEGDRSHPWALLGDVSLGVWFSQLNHTGVWGPPGSPDVTPTLSSSLPPGCCAWSSPCLSLLQGQGGAEQSDR